MTFEHLIELVLADFPELNEGLAKVNINSAYREFVAETRSLQKSSEIIPVIEQLEYDLPNDACEIYRIDFEAANGKLMTPLVFKIEEKKIRFYSRYGTHITTIPGEIAKIVLRYYAYPANLSDYTDTPVIDELFHQGILAKCMYKLHSTTPTVMVSQEGTTSKVKDWNAVRFWKSEYEDYEKKAKRYRLNATPIKPR